MPWFRLDEGFHSHPKVMKAGNEAVGLYVRCGTYAAEHLTDGFVPESIALLYGSHALADTLVKTKLWRRTRGGWRMPDYLDYNPSKEAVDKERKLAAERQRQRRAKLLRTNPVGIVLDSTSNPVDNPREADNPSSDDAVSRRDSRGDSRHPVPSRPVLNGSVVNLGNGSSARASPDVIDAILSQIHETTGRHITREWAERIAGEILRGQQVANPVAYVRQAIRNEPSPGKRFLPLY